MLQNLLLNIDAGTIDWSRAQFALTAIYHWLFVPLTLGLAVIMGIVETLGASYISAGYRDAFAFAILIIVLIFRPAGILGKKEIDKV